MKNVISCSIFLCTLALLALPLQCVADTAICHIVDPAGTPIANAVVYSVANQGGDVSTVTTDKSGTFTIDTIGNGEDPFYMVDAQGFAPGGGTLAAGENTFTLTLPTKLSGKVVDTKGQPVVGAIVCAEYALTHEANASGSPEQHISCFRMDPFTGRYTVKTDSTGKYTLDGLPVGSEVTVRLDDPHYIAKEVVSGEGAADAPSLIAEAGTFISGKVLRQDGKSINATLQVTASTKGLNDDLQPIAKVAADGTYKLTGIPPGSYNVSILPDRLNNHTADWVAPAPVKVTATIKVPGTAPDLLLKSGGIVTGVVLDADTKKPIANAYIVLDDTSDTITSPSETAKTGADGKFTAHLLPGKIVVHTESALDDYISVSTPQDIRITAEADQTVTLDPIFLKRIPVVTGTAVDDSGNPASHVVLQTKKLKDDGVWFYIPDAATSDSGAFSLHRVAAGSYWIDPGAGWTVVSPKMFTVPLASPLNVVLKKNATVNIQGAVVDTANTPVAGVDVIFYVMHRSAAGELMSNPVNVRTGANGTYTLPDVPVDPNMVRRTDVIRAGYIFKSGGEVSASNDSVVVSPIILAELGGKVSGVVYNGLGKPVPGAWVCSPDSGKDAALVQTDSTGYFKLSNLVVGSVNIYAGKGLFVSRCTLQASTTSANSIVRLPAVPTAPIGAANLTKATMLLTQNINNQAAMKNHEDEGTMHDEAAHIIAEVSPDAAVRFILSNSSISTWDLEPIIAAKTDSNPVGIANWALVPIKRMSDNTGRGQTAARIGLAAALYDPVAAQPYYDIAKQYVVFGRSDEHYLINAMRMTALAYILHRPEADDDYAKVSAALHAVLEKNKSNSNSTSPADSFPETLAKVIALGNVDKAIAILETQSTNNRYFIEPGIVAELVKPNPSAAMTFYHWVAKDTVSNNSQWARERALCFLLPVIYKTDPNSAIAQARSINDASIGARALTDLADLMPLSKAAPFYREAETKAVSLSDTDGYSPACVASHAWLRDQALGTKLFKTALTKFMAATTNAPQIFGRLPSYADFAFYYAKADPAYSRLLLELQFAKNCQSTSSYYGDNAQCDAAAMCAVDPNRAVEMAESIKDQYQSYSAGLKTAQYFLLTPQQRNELPFLEWSSRTNWVPGTPSN
jgi:hypothetical protein